MKTIGLNIALGIFLLSCFTFCNSKTEEVTPNTEVQVSFAKDIVPIFDKNCNFCHASTAPLLSNYTATKAMADNGKLVGTVAKASGFKAMPPDATKNVTAAELDLIKKWVSQGAKNN